MSGWTRRAAAVLVAAGTIVAGSAGVASAAPAASADTSSVAACHVQTIANVSSGYVIAKAGTPYHNNPAGSCRVLGYHQGTAWLWCYTQLSNHEIWYAVRDADTDSLGWVWAGNVSKVSSQALRHC